MRVLGVVASMSCALVFPSLVQAQAVDAVRFGIMGHNLEILGTGNGGKEDGVDLSGEVAFASPAILSWAAKPKVTLGGSVNTADETSFAAIGLRWDFEAAQNWNWGLGLGYAIHNGDPLDNPYAPADSTRRATFDREELALGSRDVFHLFASLEYKVSARFGVEGIYEHLSHGQILGTNRNPGMDNLGIRGVWRLR
jgi:lipid A 3-O-deacylase